MTDLGELVAVGLNPGNWKSASGPILASCVFVGGFFLLAAPFSSDSSFWMAVSGGYVVLGLAFIFFLRVVDPGAAVQGFGCLYALLPIVGAVGLLAFPQRSDSRRPSPEAAMLPRVGLLGAEHSACDAAGGPLDPDWGERPPVTVRIRPDANAPTKGTIAPGRHFWLCDRQGDWQGIVYRDNDQRPAECGVGTPVTAVRRYTGPCAAGWVNDSDIEALLL